MIKSVCIIRLSALGDVLMLVPLVRTLQKHIPGIQLTWIISRPAYDLVEGMDGVEFIVIDKPNGFGDYFRFAKRMRKRKFDALIAAQASFRANLLIPFVRAGKKIGYDKLRAKDGHHLFINETITPGHDHTLEGFLKFATALGVNQHEIEWNLPLDEASIAWAHDHIAGPDRPTILVNPASSKPERSWAIERYIAVINHLKQRWNAKIILTGGPGNYDKLLADQITTGTEVHVNLVGKTKPKQLLALIKLSNLMLCPDTGPAHMAAAVNTPVIALHAVTSADVSGPYPFRHLAIDKYPEAVHTILNKTLETNVWGTHAHGEKTMELIDVDSVIQRIDQVLNF